MRERLVVIFGVILHPKMLHDVLGDVPALVCQRPDVPRLLLVKLHHPDEELLGHDVRKPRVGTLVEIRLPECA